MISTTSPSTLPYSLGWTGWTSSKDNNPPSSTPTIEPASTSSSSQIADLQKQVQQLTALLTNPKNPLAGLSAGMLPPSSTVGLNPFGQNPQAWPMAGMPQGGAEDSSISTGPVLSIGGLLA